MKYTKIYHLSHTDLDGFGSQYMTRFLRHDGVEIKYYNANYEDVLANINSIYSDIVLNHDLIKKHNEKIEFEKKEDYLKDFDKILFLITDLSIHEAEEKKINNFFKGNKHIDLTVQVLDHHKSGLEIANRNDWYLLDNFKCGSSLTAAFTNEMHNNKELKEHLTFVGAFIQSHDIWEENSPYFNYANFLSDIIFNLYFPEEYKDEKREFLCNYIFNFVSKYEDVENVEELETAMPLILNQTLNMFMKNKDIIFDKNIRSIYKLYYYINELYTIKQSDYETFDYKGATFKVIYEMSSSCFQYFSHYFLDENPNINFLINIRDNGRSSLRASNEEIDVSIIASEISVGKGGGHAQASGARLIFKDDVHSYKELIKELLKIKNIKVI